MLFLFWVSNVTAEVGNSTPSGLVLNHVGNSTPAAGLVLNHAADLRLEAQLIPTIAWPFIISGLIYGAIKPTIRDDTYTICFLMDRPLRVGYSVHIML